MSTESITDRVLRDVLNSDTLAPYCGDDAFVNAKRWRFLEGALAVLEERGMLADPADYHAPADPSLPTQDGDDDGREAAPLDPSKVKAGDTVTVTGLHGGARPGYEITGIAWEPDHSPGTLWVGPVCITATLVTLTAHQPAPEPEPEWREGIAGAAVVGPKRREVRAYAVGKGAVIEAVGGGYAVWSADDVHDFVPDEPRPLPTRDELAAALQRVRNVTTWDRAVGSGSLTTRSAGVLADAVDALLRGETR